MTVPLDRLYHFIESVAQETSGSSVLIYRFSPDGSKNIQDLNRLHTYAWPDTITSPAIWCHDQEPLNFDYYSKNLRQHPYSRWEEITDQTSMSLPPIKNLNYSKNWFAKNFLLHSEKRSADVEKYREENELIPIYYWSHALIARDWFRFAEHVRQNKNVKKTFLIYNRAWAGTREYRLRFAELLVHMDLQYYCQASINPIEPELNIHYDQHKFINPVWRPKIVLEDHFPVSNAHSHYSADFDQADYEATDIEVVLETLFDDSRLHLTEKSLRPIAIGQPFILAGTAGSLDYLRRYGFKTFGHIWDERYDMIEDPEERLSAIADLMKQITTWLPHVRAEKMREAQLIAEYNRIWFFSSGFFNRIVDELRGNFAQGFEELKNADNYTVWFDVWNHWLSYPEAIKFLESSTEFVEPTIASARQLTKQAQELIDKRNQL